jgi:hypothetical protein
MQNIEILGELMVNKVQEYFKNQENHRQFKFCAE